MRPRVKLHDALCELLGSNHVYYRPPEKIKMSYPCIVYDVDTISATYADDVPYKRDKRYSVTIIDPDPDSDIPERLATWKTASFSRQYISDNLNHTVYTICY